MEIANWSMNTLAGYLAEHDFTIEKDNDGQVVIYTGLYQTPDGALTDKHPDDTNGGK